VIDAQLRQRSCAADHESCLAECDQSELDERHTLTSTLSTRWSATHFVFILLHSRRLGLPSLGVRRSGLASHGASIVSDAP